MITIDTKAMMAEIHTGESTHHQDQLIIPVSFSTIKATVKRPVNPIPLLLDELLLAIFFS